MKYLESLESFFRNDFMENVSVGDTVKVSENDPWEEIRNKVGKIVSINKNGVCVDFGEVLSSCPSKNCFQTSDCDGVLNKKTGLHFYKKGVYNYMSGDVRMLVNSLKIIKTTD